MCHAQCNVVSAPGPETHAGGRAYRRRRVPEVQQAEVSGNHPGQEQDSATQQVPRRQQEEETETGSSSLVIYFGSFFTS